MEDFVLLLVLLLTQTAEMSSLPYVADANHDCSGSDRYIREGSNLCCSRCPPGHKMKSACTETNDTVCEPCGTGQYMENWNFADNCHSCVRCKEAIGLRYAQTCSSTKRAKCGCMPGKYCYVGTSNKHGCHECVSHKRCNVGFGVLVPGTNRSDVRCQQCPEGTFSDTVSSTDACKPHRNCDERDIISKGNATSDTVCKSDARAQTEATFSAKPEATTIAAAVSRLWEITAVKSNSLPMHTTKSTIPGILLIATNQALNPRKGQVPDTGPDKQLAAVIGGVAGVILLIVVIALLALCKRASQKAALEEHTKVDANGNCEIDSDNKNLCYLQDTHQLSANTLPEQQCLLQNGTAGQNLCTNNTEDQHSNESTHPLQSALPLHQPESAFSEPLPLQSNVDQFVSPNGSTVQTSSQPTSPQNMTPSPLVNVNINLHIGNGACGTPAVMLKDMTPAEPKIPFGEEEESCSLLRQEDGKPSLLSVEEIGSFNDVSLKTLEQFV